MGVGEDVHVCVLWMSRIVAEDWESWEVWVEELESGVGERL
ncbi:hypothetical protein TIFTF001_038118 [Ficus carica]|uniref:Uncharacterized protein n=1 Tax=Ficus carica TaxID=3494 RepID=A0AA88JE89_FICCA|nr:hypothetical protein TIFTF001_038115 [Ficus carica]GMN69066.1 hypothetical protein TIFTF001_038118 [Ficus carica]